MAKWDTETGSEESEGQKKEGQQMRKGEVREGQLSWGRGLDDSGSVLKQALLGHPPKRGKRLFTSGVLQLQQVANFTDGTQRLAKQQEECY